MPDARIPAWAAVLIAFSLVLSACGTRIGTLYEKVLGSPRYSRATESFTRTKEVHDGLDTRFILSATWLSPEWLQAFAEEYSNIYYLDEERKVRVVARWKGESERHLRFFVALFTPDEKGNDLEKPGTLWSLRLVRSDEKDFTPVYVRKTELRPEEISRFFPYSGTWYRAYEVAFPKEAGQAPLQGKPVGGQAPLQGTPVGGQAPLQGTPSQASGTGSPRLKLVLSGVQGRAVLAW